MTRDEAEALVEEDRTYDNCMDLINKIYNDFESRTCENCKYLVTKDELECSHMFMSHQVYTSTFGWCDENLATTLDFGCNKFEKAEK